MMNRTPVVKIMERWIMRLIIFVTVISWYLLPTFITSYIFPIKRGDVSWGIAVMYHYLFFCCIVFVYSIFFPSKKILIVTLLLQTVINICFLTIRSYPYRSIEMSARTYICLIIPMLISWYVKKILDSRNNKFNGNQSDIPDDKR
jgi:hypothetical protein